MSKSREEKETDIYIQYRRKRGKRKEKATERKEEKKTMIEKRKKLKIEKKKT